MTRLLASSFLLFASSQQPPIIVKIVEPPKDSIGLAEVLLGALGLTGVLTLMALALGLVMACILFLARSRKPLG